MMVSAINRFKNSIPLFAGILFFVIMLWINPFQVDAKASKTLAVATLMVIWWVSEALPMAVVALLPIILFPLMGISSIKEASAGYGDSIIFLFLGGFMLGLAIEKWNLHKRIALNIVNLTGTSGDRIILGFILATGLLSMWLSNTATTMMMYPIAVSVIHVVSANRQGEGRLDHFSLTIMLAIAYASNFGGVATIIGTPPNVAFVGYIKQKYNYTITFTEWLAIGVPVAMMLLFSFYFVTTKWLYRNKLPKDAATGRHIRGELDRLGPVTKTEKRVLYIFIGTAFLWITKDIINKAGLIRLDDTIIALCGALALFICPAGSNDTRSTRILEWSDTSKMAWGILLLFGGGITLAAAMERAGLIESLGQWIAGIAGSGGILLVLAVTIVSMFISELMSNIAQVIVFSPVIAGIADAMGINPLLLGIPMTLAASCASMMPMGTPPNAIVFASGHIRLKDMAMAGFVMNMIGIILITLFCWFVIPVIINL